MWRAPFVLILVLARTLHSQAVHANALEPLADEIVTLRAHVSANPNDSAARLHLATMLTWRLETRAEGQRMLSALLDEDASNTPARMVYAEVLSWSSRTFREAAEQYGHLQREMPADKMVGLKLAELLSWTGKLREAERQYGLVLEQHPEEPAALIGLAEVNAWTGRGRQSIALLNAVPASSRQQRWYLARSSAEMAIGRRDRALEAVHGVYEFESSNIFAQKMEASINDWLEPQIELGGSVMRGSGDPQTSQLLQNGGWVFARNPVSGWSRLEVGFIPRASFNQAKDMSEDGISIRWEGRPHDSISLHSQFQATRFSTGPPDFNASSQIGWWLNDSVELKTGFSRQPIVDSVQSASGILVEDRLVGRARANLFSLQARYLFHRHNVDLFASGTGGIVTELGFENNHQLGFDAGIGKTRRVIRNHYFRLGYNFKYLGFERNFGSYPTTKLTPTSGGYFSPGAYLNHAAVLTLSGSTERRWSYSATFSPGVESVDNNAPKMSTYAQFQQKYRISQKLSAWGEVEFMNTHATFQRKVISAGIVIYPTR